MMAVLFLRIIYTFYLFKLSLVGNGFKMTFFVE